MGDDNKKVANLDGQQPDLGGGEGGKLNSLKGFLMTILASIILLILTIGADAIRQNSITIHQNIDSLSQAISDVMDQDIYFHNACLGGDKNEIRENFDQIKTQFRVLRESILLVGQQISPDSFCAITSIYMFPNRKIVDSITKEQACKAVSHTFVAHGVDYSIKIRDQLQRQLALDAKKHEGMYGATKAYLANAQLQRYGAETCNFS
jgi:hypothetical protein